MANEQFVAVNWNPAQLVDEATLDQLNANMVFLKNQMVDGKYQHANTASVVDIGLKVLGGRMVMNPNAKAPYSDKTVTFAGHFTANSRPHITTGILSVHERQIICTYIGIGKAEVDHRGFTARCTNVSNAKKPKFPTAVHVAWIALGY